MSNEMKCSYCSTEMFYRKDRNYYVCPHCLGEFWPSDLSSSKDKDSERRQILYSLAAQGTAINAKPVLPPGQPVFKGGSKNGKGRKKKPTKKMVSEINMV